MNFDDYKAIDAINASAICEGLKSMLHMRHAMTGGGRADTAAMKFGRQIHAAVLEPERFFHELAIWKDGRRYGKAWDAFCDEHPNADLIVTPDELDTLMAMSKALWLRRDVSGLLEGCEFEQTYQWEDARYGAAKSRIDAANLSTGAGYIIDYKSCSDLAGFMRNAYNLHYHIRMGWYAHGLDVLHGKGLPNVYLIAQESAPPYDCGLINIPHTILAPAVDEAIEVAECWAVCSRMNTFPGVMPEMVEFELPAWATNVNAEIDMEGAEEL